MRALWISLVLFIFVPGTSVTQAGETSLGIIPDPSCRSSKLVIPVEQALVRHLRLDDIRIISKNPLKARLLLQYYISLRRDVDQVFVQLDGQVLGNVSGKLFAEGSVRSSMFADDRSGRIQAAQQAAKKLAERISKGLAISLNQEASDRSIMLQLSLHENVLPRRQAILDELRRGLGRSLRLRGSTERNLMLMIKSAKPTSTIADAIERVIQDELELSVSWQVKTNTTLMLRIESNQP